ncbi:MAG: carboxypeptidase-like regulatory domain-containing protein [Sphingobacterium hotanense]
MKTVIMNVGRRPKVPVVDRFNLKLAIGGCLFLCMLVGSVVGSVRKVEFNAFDSRESDYGRRISKGQQRELKGIVKSVDGKPLGNVSVLIKGTSEGTKTQPDGSFTLETTKASGVLILTHVGYETRRYRLILRN